MLQAKNQYGIMTTPALMTMSEIHLLRRDLFFCPVCRSPVIMRAGPKVIPHFAHKANDNCPDSEQGEGIYHEHGKLLLFNWLHKQFPQNSFLEAWLPEIRQRPDIYLRLLSKQIALEYQCARIPIRDINKRNQGYYQHSTIPIWILGGTHFRRQSRHEFRINSFMRQFIHHFIKKDFRHPLVLFFFDPHTKEMAIVQDIHELTPSLAMGNIQINPLGKIKFTDLFKPNPFSTSELLSLWKKAKYRFRLAAPGRMHGNNLLWQQWLYDRKSHRERLPACVYLPVQFQHLMKTPIWDWQSRLYLDLLRPMMIGEHITLQKCFQYINKHLSDGLLFTDAITFHHHPIREFFQWLTILEVMQEITPDIFEKCQDIIEPAYIEEAIQADRQLLDNLSQKLSTNKTYE